MDITAPPKRQNVKIHVQSGKTKRTLTLFTISRDEAESLVANAVKGAYPESNPLFKERIRKPKAA